MYFSFSACNKYLVPKPEIESNDAESDDDTGLRTALYALIDLLVLLVAVFALVWWRKMQKLKRTVTKPGIKQVQ